jgi:hypothetical protein
VQGPVSTNQLSIVIPEGLRLNRGGAAASSCTSSYELLANMSCLLRRESESESESDPTRTMSQEARFIEVCSPSNTVVGMSIIYINPPSDQAFGILEQKRLPSLNDHGKHPHTLQTR